MVVLLSLWLERSGEAGGRSVVTVVGTIRRSWWSFYCHRGWYDQVKLVVVLLSPWLVRSGEAGGRSVVTVVGTIR